MHGMPADDVEFHEVGSVDAIVDIVGTCAALESLGVERIVCSSITVGEGTVLAAHGQLPNPAPAVTELLARRNAPSRGIDDRKELATPTGVALMCALADEFGPMPAINVTSVGYGAGSCRHPRASQRRPGRHRRRRLSRACVPEPGQPVQLLETNVDDATGEVIAHTIAALIAAGAHDAWATPIVMKKGRPAHTVHVLCDPSAAPLIGALLLRETGSLGLRGTELRRWPQQRTERQVVVDGHTVRRQGRARPGEGRVRRCRSGRGRARPPAARRAWLEAHGARRTRRPVIPPFVDAEFVAGPSRSGAGRRALVPRRPRWPCRVRGRSHPRRALGRPRPPAGRDTTNPATEGRHPFPTPGDFAAAMGSLGHRQRHGRRRLRRHRRAHSRTPCGDAADDRLRCRGARRRPWRVDRAHSRPGPARTPTPVEFTAAEWPDDRLASTPTRSSRIIAAGGDRNRRPFARTIHRRGRPDRQAPRPHPRLPQRAVVRGARAVVAHPDQPPRLREHYRQTRHRRPA